MQMINKIRNSDPLRIWFSLTIELNTNTWYKIESLYYMPNEHIYICMHIILVAMCEFTSIQCILKIVLFYAWNDHNDCLTNILFLKNHRPLPIAIRHHVPVETEPTANFHFRLGFYFWMQSLVLTVSSLPQVFFPGTFSPFSDENQKFIQFRYILW